MADPSRFTFDVWLTHAGTVYRAVPFNVVTDWIQQGRLLEDDRIRPVGTEQWMILGQIPAFAAFIPKNEALRTDAQAEALEPVESPFAWGGKQEGEEADPDMIPLIDVSLVLLIFFMLTSSISVITSMVRLPGSANAFDLSSNTKLIRITLEVKAEDRPPIYTFSAETDEGKANFNDLNKDQTLQKLEEGFTKQNMIPEVRLAIDRLASFELVKELAIALEKHKSVGRIGKITYEVAEKKK